LPAVLLTLTTTHRPATDLGYLLHKHPERVQAFGLPFGTAHVLYPEATAERCTAALVLEVDPVGLVRRGRGAGAFALAEYVNDRPYVASSLLSVALVSVYKSALDGVCRERPELAAAAIPLEAALPAVPARGGEALVQRLFAPLGYAVEATPLALDPLRPEWGTGRHVALRLSGTVRLADLLTHLYVLLPVLDDEKHYWVGEAEVAKLLRRGGAWLPAHPERELIARRYLKHERRLVHPALAALDEAAPPADDDGGREADLEERVSLRDQRLGTVQAVLKASGARRVLDLGCGSGALLERLLRDGYEQVTGADVSPRALATAARRLKADRHPELTLLQSPLTYRDRRLAGYDAAALVEVIEHFDPPRLEALEENVFGSARPATVVVTTPNAEYNRLWETLPAGERRHPDHRFEWTRAELAAWAERVAAARGYRVRLAPVGPEDPQAGPPTQMAVFER
jgi:3' terminal RNA ribose 2'-O-methyltransferase Hen1